MTRTTVFLPLVAIVSALAAVSMGQDTLVPLQFLGIGMAVSGVIMAQARSEIKEESL